MRGFYKSLALGFAIAACALVAQAASIPSYTGPSGSNPAQVPNNVPDLNSLVNAINSTGATGVNSNTLAPYGSPRNFLDNGSIDIAQRGTSATAGASTGGSTTLTYVADRWWVDTNVSSGAGYGQVITATPSPRTGFTNSMKVYRNSGSLAQPVCVMQEVETIRSIPLQGQQATFSVYIQALAGLNADNGSAANLYIFTGTGSDQGLGSLTASPAITPAWTGIASSTTKAITLTTAWAQYSVTGTIPTAAKEIAVAICFTPTTTSSGGSTDGFAFVGAQLEQGATPSSFEFQSYGYELAAAQRYFWQLADGAATVRYPGVCVENVSGTSALCTWNLPQVMRAAPTPLIGTTNSFGKTKVADGTALVCTTNVYTASSATTTAFSALCSVSETAAVGTASQIIGGATAGTITVTADF